MRKFSLFFTILLFFFALTSLMIPASEAVQPGGNQTGNGSPSTYIPAVNATTTPFPLAATNSSNKTISAPVNTSLLKPTAVDQQFLFLMNQYWIPDLYDIKGRIDGSTTFGTDLPQMLNLTADYARIRLNKNINETNGYSLSPEVMNLRTEYQTGAVRCIRVIDGIMALNRSSEKFGQDVPTRTAALSLYGTWLEYRTMKCYTLPNITYPDIAAVPPDQFMQVMGAITS